jgi:hypothetical protein
LPKDPFHGNDGPTVSGSDTDWAPELTTEAPGQQIASPIMDLVTPDFMVKLNAHSICAQESSLHTYRT